RDCLSSRQALTASRSRRSSNMRHGGELMNTPTHQVLLHHPMLVQSNADPRLPTLISLPTSNLPFRKSIEEPDQPVPGVVDQGLDISLYTRATDEARFGSFRQMPPRTDYL